MYIDKVLTREFAELREKNLATIKGYFELEGAGYLDAWKFYEDQALTGIYTTESGVPECVGGGIDHIKDWYEYNVKYFPNWKNNEVVVFQKEDPSKFFVRVFCEGDVDLPDYPKTHVSTLFHHDFEMRNGKILVHWAHTNPAIFIQALGAGEFPPVVYPDLLGLDKK